MRPLNLRVLIIFLLAALANSSNLYAQENTSSEVKDISELLIDNAAGNVTAGSLLGISNDAVTTVENTRGIVAAARALGTSKSGVGISITPARTSLTPMSLSTYDKGIFYRLLGNLTIAYAQGSSQIESTNVERRAYSIETSYIVNRNDDPVLAVVDSCKWKIEGDIAPDSNSGQTLIDAANKKYLGCVSSEQSRISKKWNATRFSVAIGSGVVKPENSNSTSLGRTLAGGIVYGFDHFDTSYLKDGMGLALTLRRTADEPIANTLISDPNNKKSSTLVAARISGGGDKFRGIVEFSNANKTDLTISQRVFKYAAGIDFKAYDGIWINFRVGKVRKEDGMGDETASLMNISFSPSALLTK